MALYLSYLLSPFFTLLYNILISTCLKRFVVLLSDTETDDDPGREGIRVPPRVGVGEDGIEDLLRQLWIGCSETGKIYPGIRECRGLKVIVRDP